MSEKRNTEGLRLYRATVEVEFYVAAENAKEAEQVAEQKAADAIADQWWVAPTYVSEVRDPRQLDAEDRDSLPYSDDFANEQELTCAEILADPPAPTDPELEAAGQLRLDAA